jgi:hypothetical protein
MKEGTKIYWAEDPSLLPEEMAETYHEEYGSAKIALTGSKP